jgi:hypothetical protein
MWGQRDLGGPHDRHEQSDALNADAEPDEHESPHLKPDVSDGNLAHLLSQVGCLRTEPSIESRQFGVDLLQVILGVVTNVGDTIWLAPAFVGPIP